MQGYSEAENTWEPVEHIDNCPDKVRMLQLSICTVDLAPARLQSSKDANDPQDTVIWIDACVTPCPTHALCYARPAGQPVAF